MAPFTHHVLWHPGSIVEISVTGHMDANTCDGYLLNLTTALEDAADASPSGRVALLFLDNLASFDRRYTARAHGHWFLKNKATIDRVAIVSNNPAMPVAAAVGMIVSRKPITMHCTYEEAMRFLEAVFLRASYTTAGT